MQLGIDDALRLAEDLLDRGRTAESLRAAAQVAAQVPDNAAVLRRACVLACRAGALEAAGSWAAALLRLAPEDPDALNVLGIAAMRRGEHVAAKDLFDRLARRAPGAPAWRHLALACAALDELDEALALHRRAAELAPGDPAAWGSLGDALLALGRSGEAREAFRRILEIAPADAEARFSLAFTHLLEGDWDAGLPLMEARLETPGWRDRPPLPRPAWRGEDLAGKAVFVASEAGFGDTLQFARFVPALAARGAHVLLGVQPELAGLLADSLPGVTVAAGRPPEAGACDLACWLHSLPLLLGARPDALPLAGGFLRPRPAVPPFTAPGRELRVGLSWRGNPSELRSRRKSVPPGALLPLIRTPGCRFYSLQKGPVGQDLDGLPPHLRPLPLDARIQDFAGTAALVAELDAVVSICSVAAHLAGSLGARTLVLLSSDPYWCWGRAGETTPWYAGVRLLRQERPGDWAPVVARAAAELAALAAGRA